MALLIADQRNIWAKAGSRPQLGIDIFPDPLAPTRLDAAQEARRTGQIAGDYRRLRAERLARTESRAVPVNGSSVDS